MQLITPLVFVKNNIAGLRHLVSGRYHYVLSLRKPRMEVTYMQQRETFEFTDEHMKVVKCFYLNFPVEYLAITLGIQSGDRILLPKEITESMKVKVFLDYLLEIGYMKREGNAYFTAYENFLLKWDKSENHQQDLLVNSIKVLECASRLTGKMRSQTKIGWITEEHEASIVKTLAMKERSKQIRDMISTKKSDTHNKLLIYSEGLCISNGEEDLKSC